MPTSRKPKKKTAKVTSKTFERAPKKGPAKKAAPKKAAAKRATPAKAKKAAPRATSASKPPRRADFGAPIEGFFAKQSPAMRPLVDALRAVVEEEVPGATASLKWGMPFYTLHGETVCAIAGHKAHVNMILSGPPGTFVDPEGLLEGEGKTGRHLRLTANDEVPRAALRRWLRAAVANAQKNGAG